MSDLDFLLMTMSHKDSSIPIVEGATFMVGLKKLAEELGTPTPDVTGQVEGPFLVPLPQAVELMAQMVSNEFKTQVYYTYYANMLRGLAHEGIAEEFMEHAKDELDHANYLLRRIGVLSPGGISIPPYPPPPPMTDPQQIIQSMIVVEQMGIALWKHLHSILGENPMKYTVEQYLQKEEEHQDELWQLVDPAASPPTPAASAPSPDPKTASEILDAAVARKKEASHALDRQELLRAGMDPSYAGKKEHNVSEKEKKAADLTPGARAQVSESNFVFPEQRKYPIHDKDHALAALGMVGMHGTPEEKSAVRAAVEKKYPGLQMQKKAFDRDAVIKDKAKSLITAATENIRKMTDMIPKPDQNRVEILSRPPESLLHEKAVFDTKKKAPVTKTSSLGSLIAKLAEDIMLPPPGADSPESYIAREQQLAAQQAMAEAAHAKTVSMQSAQAAQQAQAEAQAAQQQLQESQAQLEQMQQQAQQASQAQIQAQQAASEAEARAAEHSISKMQLGMRVNQMRQALANLVMQDPVSEHAATVSDLAAQGQPATPQQQQEAEMAQQQAAAMDPAQGGAPPSADAQQEAQEAQNAQQHAEVQGAQAQQAQQADQAKAQAKQASKLASLIDATARKAGRAAAEGAGEAITEAAKKYAPHAAATALGGGALLAAHAHGARERRKEDMASAVAEGMRRAKSAGLADRNLARAVMEGGHDTLGRELIDVVKRGLPAEAALAGAGHAIRGAAEEGGKAVVENLPTLGEKLRPHLPGLVTGLGTGIIGTRMLSGNGRAAPDISASPLSYAQYYGQGQ